MRTGSKQRFRRKSDFLKRLLLVIGVSVSGFVLFAFTAFYAIPVSFIESSVKDSLRARTGLILAADSLRKVFPFGIEADNLTISGGGSKALLRLDRFRLTVSPLGIFSGRLAGFAGRVGQGSITGDIGYGLNGASMSVQAYSIGLSDVPALREAGMDINGEFSASLSVARGPGGCPAGFVRAVSGEIKGSGISYRGLPLPLGEIYDAGLTAELRDCKAKVLGVWLEGDDLSARAKGDVSLASPLSSSALDLTLEVTPKGPLLEKEFILSAIRGYRKSANYYSIPIKGTLGSPAAG